MAESIWPRHKSNRLFLPSVLKLIAAILVVSCVVRCQYDGMQVESNESNSGGSEVTKGQEHVIESSAEGSLPAKSQPVFHNKSYHVDASHSKNKRGKKRKRLKNRNSNGNYVRRKKKKGVISSERFSAVEWSPPSTVRPLHPLWNVTRAESILEKSTIIRTSEDDNPRNRLLIETVLTNSKPEVRYYPNYPLHWQEGTLRPQQTTTQSAPGRIYILQTGTHLEGRPRIDVPGSNQDTSWGTHRYGTHYSTWMGLRYGELTVVR